MTIAVLVVYGGAVVSVLLGWGYFRRFTIPRPPLGRFNLADIAITTVGIIALPLIYLSAPLVVVAGVFAVAVLNVVALVSEPVVRGRWAVWLIVLGLGTTELGAWALAGRSSRPFLAINDLVLGITVAGVANLWTQSGLRARDAAILGGILAAYDAVATAWLPLTTNLFARMAGMPFAPIMAWSVAGTGQWVGLGLGDLLFATLFPLVLRKAFGRPAGVGALIMSLGALGVLLAMPAVIATRATFPVMVVLGPLMIAQYVCWRRARGSERTTFEYLRAEPGVMTKAGGANHP